MVTLVTCLIAPMGTPLMGTLMLGNLLKESGVADRLVKASQNEIANIVTLLLGISIGATMAGPVFLKPQTLIVLGLGLVAISLDTAMGIFLAKIMKILSGGKVNPLIGAAGISAFPCPPGWFRWKDRKPTRRITSSCMPWEPIRAGRSGRSWPPR